jgi:hypothetical protein
MNGWWGRATGGVGGGGVGGLEGTEAVGVAPLLEKAAAPACTAVWARATGNGRTRRG